MVFLTGATIVALPKNRGKPFPLKLDRKTILEKASSRYEAVLQKLQEKNDEQKWQVWLNTWTTSASSSYKHLVNPLNITLDELVPVDFVPHQYSPFQS
jgi:hypothetical protein